MSYIPDRQYIVLCTLQSTQYTQVDRRDEDQTFFSLDLTPDPTLNRNKGKNIYLYFR